MDKTIASKFNISIKLIVILLLITSLLVLPEALSAATSLTDLKAKQAEITKQINANAEKAKQKQAEIDKVNSEIAELDKDMNEIQAKITDTQNKMNQTEKEIGDKQIKIEEKQRDLEIELEKQKESIREMYEGGSRDTFQLIIASNSLSEIIDESQYLETVESQIESIMEDINNIKNDLENQKKELEVRKNDLIKLKEQQDAYKFGLEQQKSKKNKLLNDATGQKKSLDDQIAEAKKLNDQVQNEINAVIAASNKGTGGAVVARDKGVSSVGFQYPMDYKYISCNYGESTPFQSFHSGVDFVNIAGTPVYAAANGTVTAVKDMMIDGRYYAYGKYIVIGHNARFTSLYGHLMGFAVKEGDEVHAGDVIGYEGSTGWSTGAHLHFEVREFGNIVNPMNYLPK